MIKAKRRSICIILLAWLAYLTSYLGRSDYSACLLKIIADAAIPRAAAGMVSSSFALCNALGQLATAAIVRRVRPIPLISLELFGVMLVNLAFPFSEGIGLMILLWGLNGALQATLLSGLTGLFADTLEEPWLSRGAVLLNTIGAVGGMINYLAAPVLIAAAGWQAVFYTVSSLLGTMLLAWCVLMPRLSEKSGRTAIHEARKKGKIIRRGLGLTTVVFLSFLVGMMRESVTLWLPSYLYDSFATSSARATTLTAAVPMLQILGAFFGGWLGRRAKSIFLPTALFFLLSSLCFGMIQIQGIGILPTVFLFAINAIAMTAALTLLVSIFPIQHLPRGDIAGFVAILNFFVHLGDFAASTGYGWLSTLGGWGLSLTVMAMLSLLAAAVALFATKETKKRRMMRNGKEGI